MTRHVLVPLDGSEQSWDALEYALAEFDDVEVTALHVINPLEAGFTTEAAVPGYSEEWYERSKREAEELFEEARNRADDAGASLSTHVEHGRPTRAVVNYAEEHGVDHVVMGSHGRAGMTRVLLGSVAEGVVRRSPVPVTIVR